MPYLPSCFDILKLQASVCGHTGGSKVCVFWVWIVLSGLAKRVDGMLVARVMLTVCDLDETLVSAMDIHKIRLRMALLTTER